MTAVLASPRPRPAHKAAPFAERLLSMVDLDEDDFLLVPCAGRGTLITPILAGSCAVPYMTILVERDAETHRLLEERLLDHPDAPILAVHGDFCDMGDVYRPTAIVMVPPLTGQQDVQHILHAWEVLAPGGRMAAICSLSSLERQTVLCQAFRAGMERVGAEIVPVSDLALENSDVDAAVILLRKPRD